VAYYLCQYHRPLFSNYKNDKELFLLTITICKPVTGWFEDAEIKDKTAAETAKILDQVWLYCYP
jgi:hypothetical protein